MRTALLRLTTLAAVLVSLSPPVLRAQEGIFVTDFSNRSPLVVGLAGPAHLRRGVTSTVEIDKNLIDLVPFAQIHVRGGATIGTITNGRSTSSGTGFIRMPMTVPPGQGVGSTITLDVGFLDHFNFTVEHTGMLAAAPRLTPNPATVVAGTPIVITATGGTDFGNPVLAAMFCHATSNESHTQATFTVTVTRAATSNCSGNGPFGFSVHGSGTGDPFIYATAQGVFGFPFPAYLVPPPTPGLICQSVPGIGAPTITSPANGQVFAFAAGSNPSQSMPISWGLHTESNQLAPNNEWLVTAPPLEKAFTTSTVVQGTLFVRSYPLPGTYRVSVRAKNCGEASPSATVSFELKFQ